MFGLSSRLRLATLGYGGQAPYELVEGSPTVVERSETKVGSHLAHLGMARMT